MKKIILIINFALLACLSNAQNPLLDTLKKELAQPKDDTDKLFALSRISVTYTYSKPDTAIVYAKQAIALAKKMKSDFALSFALKVYAGVLSQTGNYPQAIYFNLESLKLAEKANDVPSIGWSYAYLAETYTDAEDYEHALYYTYKQKSLYESHPNLSELSEKMYWHDRKRYWDDQYSNALEALTTIYTKLNLPDSALKYLQIYNRRLDTDSGTTFYFYGNIYFNKGDYAEAIRYYKTVYQTATFKNISAVTMLICNDLAKTYRKLNQPDSSIFMLKK